MMRWKGCILVNKIQYFVLYIYAPENPKREYFFTCYFPISGIDIISVQKKENLRNLTGIWHLFIYIFSFVTLKMHICVSNVPPKVSQYIGLYVQV